MKFKGDSPSCALISDFFSGGVIIYKKKIKKRRGKKKNKKKTKQQGGNFIIWSSLFLVCRCGNSFKSPFNFCSACISYCPINPNISV